MPRFAPILLFFLLLPLQAHEVQRQDTITPPSASSDESALLDLSPQEHTSLQAQASSHVLARPWWQNFEFSGFGAIGYYDTGSNGAQENGEFIVKEASLFIEAEVWENLSFFLEFQTNRLGMDDDRSTGTGEVYIHAHEIPLGEAMVLGVKLGRIDIPFGEEYLWRDSIDNPLITNSAPFVYGVDDGILLHSKFKGIQWLAAVTDGHDDEFGGASGKAFNLKFSGDPWESVYLSTSLMYNGSTELSAVGFGGSYFQPVAEGFEPSTLGSSSSKEVEAWLLGFDAKYRFPSTVAEGYISLSLGAAQQQDDAPGFDRSLRWFSLESLVRFRQSWYAVARYSEIGTYEEDEGYHFEGKIFADGQVFGFDIKRFRRLGLGLGWRPNPHIRAKLEIGKDWFDLIDASAIIAPRGDREFLGLEIAVGF